MSIKPTYEELEQRVRELESVESRYKKILKEQQQKDNRYKYLFDNMLNEVHFWELVFDDAGNIKTWKLVDANPTALKSWGKKLDEITGKITDDIFPNSNATELFMPVVRKIFTEGKPHIWESYFPDTKQFLHMISVPLGNFFMSAGFDISEHKKVQTALRYSEQRLTLATQSAGIGIWDWDIITDEMVWDEHIFRLYGIEKIPEHYGLDYWQNCLHPDDREPIAEACQAAVRGEKKYNVEFRVQWPDGTIRWMKGDGVVLRDDGGTPIRMLGTNYDITERKKLEEENQQILNRFRTIFEEAPLGVALINSLTGHIYEVNDKYANIAGRTRDEITNIDWMEITHPDDVQEDLDNMARLNAGEINGFQMEKRYIKPDGTINWINMTISPILVRDKTKPRHLCMVEDVSERKKAENERQQLIKKLKRSNNDLKQFAYVASHDLQEPLRAVAGFLQLLKSRYDNHLDDKGQHYIERSVKAAERMQILINDLLNLSRVSTQELRFELINISIVAEEVLDSILPKIEEKGATINLEALPTLPVDSVKIHALLQNLISNALKYNNSERPVIKIGQEEGTDEHRFFITDNGIGIDSKFHDRIFMIFQRLHTTRQYSGTGIGLALCKKIVELHNGRIWVESQKGNGSTFYFTLPKKRMINEQ